MFHFVVYLVLTAGLASGQDSEESLDTTSGRLVRYLIPSNAGMAYYTQEADLNASEVIYDCSLGSFRKGKVNVFDKTHPSNIKFLTVKNCLNITLEFSNIDRRSAFYEENPFPLFRSLRIRNVEYLLLDSEEGDFRSQNLSLTISNIKTLGAIKRDNRGPYYSDYYQRGPKYSDSPSYFSALSLVSSLTLENLTLSYLNSKFFPPKLSMLHLKAVIIGEVRENTFSLATGAVLRITDSYVGNFQQRGFVGNAAEVQLLRNVFDNLDDDAFTGTVSNCFLLSGNTIARVGSSFNVTTPNLQVVNNTFGSHRSSFLQNFHIHGDTATEAPWKSTYLNLSDNSLNAFPADLFSSFKFTSPDVIVLENNRINCSCKHQELFEMKSFHKDVFRQIFMNEKNNNVCANFDNCELRKLLGGMDDVCQGKFICPAEYVETEDFEQFLKRSINVMINHLQNISKKLSSLEKADSLGEKHPRALTVSS